MKNKKRKIAIIGHFGGKEFFVDGQTVSTRLLKNVLEKSEAFSEVRVIDTYNYRKNFLKVFFSWLGCQFSCTYIILMLSGNGLKFFSPLLYFANKIFHRKVYHRVIGGELDKYLKNNPECVKYMNSFEVNWVQSEKLVERLNEIEIKNAEYLENFRDVKPVIIPENQEPFEKPLRFCTFCRVSEAKGISTAIKAIAETNKIFGEKRAILDIYGPIESDYEVRFKALVEQNKDCVTYMGSIPSDKATETLKDYYMHLFPTTWSGEGFPGTLIDCYNAALPTIASDWAYNSELIVDGVNGYLYDWRNPELLVDKIKEAIENEDNMWSMKKMCLKEAEKYKSEVVTEKIIKRILGEP